MSPRDWKARIRDILDAISEILLFVGSVDFDTFRHDMKTIRAVELNFIIIGEAANAIPEEIQELHPDVPWYFMRAMRNRLVHVYFEVDPKLVWDTVKNDLPALKSSLEALIG
ncbi:MAG: DUF86 domain-containing protein [Anaerolineales bacterium]|nr:DUF86 domain-containing protein [Anaerolineales bacterium]